MFAHVGNDENGEYSESATFAAARGEKNRLTVSTGRWGVVFHDAGSKVRARRNCKSIGRHIATCRGASGVVIRLRGRNDRAKLQASVFAAVYGGRGDDRLTGGLTVLLFGGTGNDVLRGGGGPDLLNGGLGRDRLFGAGGDDEFVDGETDAQAAPDVFDGGDARGYGDAVDFGLRKMPLRIDLAHGRTSMGDAVIGVERTTSGSGDDRLTGNAAANWLDAGPGADIVRGRAGNDIVRGGPGDDRLSGGAGNDAVWGLEDRDRLDGGAGDDLLESHDFGRTAEESVIAENVTCGDGADRVISDPSDTLEPACERLWADPTLVATVPSLREDNAQFGVGCMPGNGCAGLLALHSVAGEEYGKATFEVPPNGRTTVSVPLSAAGVAALRAGATVQVDVQGPVGAPSALPSGYRMFLRYG